MLNTSTRSSGVPAALLLAERVSLVSVTGKFDEDTQTWSTREFACAAAKKHNEDM